MNLMTILQLLNMKRSVMMLFSLNDNEKNAVIKDDDISAVI